MVVCKSWKLKITVRSCSGQQNRFQNRSSKTKAYVLSLSLSHFGENYRPTSPNQRCQSTQARNCQFRKDQSNEI